MPTAHHEVSPSNFEGEVLSRLQDDLLPDHLLTRRWYAAKDAGRPTVRIVDVLPLPLPGGTQAQLCLLRVEPPGREPQLYQLPLILDPLVQDRGTSDDSSVIPGTEDLPIAGRLRDGYADDAVVRALLGVMLTAGSDGGSPLSQGLRGGRTQACAAMADRLATGALHRMSAEQSNTSVRIGGEAIMKGLRKLEPGVHPELEVSRFLTEVAGFPNTPALLGWVERSNSSGFTTLCVMQELVPDAKDAWSHLTGYLNDRVARFEDGADARAADDGMFSFLRLLGQRTAELHRALATPGGGEDFTPEPVTAERLRGWADGVRVLAERVLEQLRSSVPALDRAIAAQAMALVESRSAVLAQIAALAPSDANLCAMRLHGDYHLGQVLVSHGDVQIVDFEGEPMRPLAERRAKHCILRDVAGMLRSIAYAAAMADAAIPAHLDGPSRDARVSWLGWWESGASAAFLDGYRGAIGDCPGFPREPRVAAELLKLFLLEKALYEVGYELANRPDWVAIPLAGVTGIIRADAGPEIASRERDRIPPVDERRRSHAMPFGAEVQPDGSVRFSLWAPSAASVLLSLEDGGPPLPMEDQGDGWYGLTTARAQAGSRYRFVLPDGLAVPDPASRYQPDDVHGVSEVIDPGVHAWADAAWTGRPWHETVLYELHVGTFTPAGTFLSAIERLDDLVELGVTAIELMPVADFPGARNWGYDGVLPYAPDSAYGRPEDLKTLVQEAHARGLMVFLDVVYNHFGPEGNYLHAFAGTFFTDRHKTPWGAAINVDGERSQPVRDFFIHNALYWLEEYHLDGLRLDAVHAILDDSDKHVLEELAERVHSHFQNRRHVHLVLENDANQARFLTRHGEGDPRWHTAQWNDDLHHCLHSAATGEDGGYYADYAHDPARLGRALAEGFAFQGDPSAYRDGERRGEPSAHLPPTAFVTFIQNHDQIGNRAFGERIAQIAPAEAVRAATLLYLLGPGIPMLFMGEEWASAKPFPFFCDFGDELAEAVRKGRAEEFAKFPEFQDPEARARIPDPTAPETAESAKLDWEARSRPEHAGWLDWYRRALAVRRTEIVPRLDGSPGGSSSYEVVGGTAVKVCWTLGDGSRLHAFANLAKGPAAGFPEVTGRVLWTEGEGLQGDALAPWSVVLWLEESSALDRLADRMGIERSFDNAAGETVSASEGTVRALLTAMGVDAGTDEAATACLVRMDQEELTRLLPPVVVRRAGAAPTVPVILPEGARTLRYTLTLESGETQSGVVGVASLPRCRCFTIGGRRYAERRLPLGDLRQAGYHTLKVETDQGVAETRLVLVPARCHLPTPMLVGERLWGMAAQLYTLRSDHDWGIGDFGDLRTLADIAAARGAAVIGLNPLHALFLDNPDHASPYSPASRLFLNPLYIDVTAVPEFLDDAEARKRVASPEFRSAMEAARSTTHVDYAAVSALKLPVLEGLFAHFQTSAKPERRAAFDLFWTEGGRGLERFATFQALREHFAAAGRPDWHRWPAEFHDAAAPAVAAFAKEHSDRVAFFAWLQWLADDQLRAAAERAAGLGMAIGFYRDLAVGADAGGAETWTTPQVVVDAAHVGAPPDLFNPAGQDWGLPPFHPRALREAGYQPFIELLRANMRHAGALRIDHVMALQHVYWIPDGHPPSEGAYVRYPMEDMLGILALESQRHRCLVVGEDLGTVPNGFRERMAEAGVLSYRVVFFEWTEDGSFKGPDDYPALALATVGSHDLATLRGWWEGDDITLKADKGLYPAADEADKQRARRAADRTALVDALRAAGIALPAGLTPDSPYDDSLDHAVHTFLARTNSALAVAQLDDMTREREQVNLPGTTDQYPNWRRKLSMTLEELADAAEPAAVAAILAAARPASAPVATPVSA
ncbi:malto-oligosyltrehalose trehalohydrolase [Azospirillum picis]|uniref:4-alpha-glucanotransferase n=1 Tax=Azospirillum picis TaxID=488438 RepID=A0ABU0MH09_9PROT|nr:malto-oligosyltrehalose trehalohydrolase [Azospirillum picis]MBP2299057.1 malto-oligosyltrehalose trehalohydrolase/4-alpha-glucanotransferase [Azospirillum picis]MDQ0532701.1 malto-oligosyltrehalose trehalohydrolase/4-alpha-glucanotransferase [Azospirillum picis]